MKEIFVVGGLDTSEKKQEAEALLKQLGYKDDKHWNEEYRDENDCTFISTQQKGVYSYHTHDCNPRPLITLTQLKSKAMKVDNVVIKSVKGKDGKRIIEHFKNLGFDTCGFSGECSEALGNSSIYYGVIDGHFNNYSLGVVEKSGARIETLPDEVIWTRKQFKSLHSIACNEWKRKLIKMFPSFATEDKCEITESEYDSMMSACTIKQKELMSSIFGAEPFKKKVMFMCTKDFGYAFSKGKEYELVSVTSDGYELINENNGKHHVSVGRWADYFYRID
jgi:hypothetical protein